MTNTLSASIYPALKAIEEKQEKIIQNLENIDFLQKEQTKRNEFIKTMMITQKDLVNFLSKLKIKS